MQQKAHVSAQGLKQRKVELALMLDKGVAEAGTGAAIGMLHSCGGRSGGAEAW